MLEAEIGKSTKTKSTTTNSPPAFAVPIIQGGANDVLNNYTQNQPGQQALENQLTGSIIPGIQQQIGDTRQQLQPGFNYVNSTLSPNFLNNGQSQAQALGNFAGQQAGNAVNSAFSMAGRTGSVNHATDLARGVTQAELQPMLQNLQYNEGVQNQAAGMLPGYTSAQYQGYTPLLGASQLAGQLPYYGSQSLGTIGSLVGGYGTSTSTQKQPGGIIDDLLGAASMAIPFIPGFGKSDRRLKTKIEKLGEAKDGLGIYEWNWKSDPNGQRVRGVIADEVEKLRPWAYAKGFFNGFDGVNYGALGSLA